jgi:hypothetical protein
VPRDDGRLFEATLCFNPATEACSIVSGGSCNGPFAFKWVHDQTMTPASSGVSVTWPGGSVESSTEGTVSGSGVSDIPLDTEVTTVIEFTPDDPNEQFRLSIPFTLTATQVTASVERL